MIILIVVCVHVALALWLKSKKKWEDLCWYLEDYSLIYMSLSFGWLQKSTRLCHRRRRVWEPRRLARFLLNFILNSLETAYVSLPCFVHYYKYIMVLLQKKVSYSPFRVDRCCGAETRSGREVDIWTQSGPEWAVLKMHAEPFIGVLPGRRGEGEGS
jgi:hypothetical protein